MKISAYIIFVILVSVHYCMGQKDLPRLVHISIGRLFGEREYDMKIGQDKFTFPNSYGGIYKVYGKNGMVGSTNLKPVKNQEYPSCPGFICDKTFQGKESYIFHEGESFVGISEGWDAQPRIPKRLNEKDPKYARIVKEWAESHDMRHLKQFDVHDVYEVDLDNDGKQDLIISAGNMSMHLYTDDDHFNGVFVYKNDVLFEVAVFYVTKKKAQRCSMENAIMPEAGCRGNLYRYVTSLDVDGDGKMEVIVDCALAYEGFDGIVYRWRGNEFTEILHASCP